MSYPADFNKAYLQQQMANATPLQQLLLLLDGVIKFVSRARDAIAAGDPQERHNYNRRAMEIIAHLLGMIDVTNGGEPAIRLRRIYGYLMRRLSDVDFKNDPAVCDEVIGHLKTMRDAWAGMQAAAPVQPKAEEVPVMPVKRSAVA